jgi:hypothetical protein
LRPIEIAGDKLFIRCGLFGDVEINSANIDSVDVIESPFEMKDNELKLTPLGDFTACNLKISLRNEAYLNSIYGKRKKFRAIYLSMDEAEKFTAEIKKVTKKLN